MICDHVTRCYDIITPTYHHYIAVQFAFLEESLADLEVCLFFYFSDVCHNLLISSFLSWIVWLISSSSWSHYCLFDTLPMVAFCNQDTCTSKIKEYDTNMLIDNNLNYPQRKWKGVRYNWSCTHLHLLLLSRSDIIMSLTLINSKSGKQNLYNDSKPNGNYIKF